MSDQLQMFEPTICADSRNAISSQESADGPTRLGSRTGRRKDLAGLVRAHASHLLIAASEKVLTTIGTSGRRGSTLLRSLALQLSLGNKLQAKLPWDGWITYSTIWKERATPAGRRICALRVSDRRSGGRGFIGWQTPTTRDGKGQSGRGNRIKRGKNGRLHVANLCDQLVDYGRPDLVRSPQFRSWLMGYPEQWDSAGVTAMQSIRGSRKSLSRRS